jgi:hypothetical protein
MPIFSLTHSTRPSSAAMRLLCLILCALTCACSPDTTELDKQELALYNDALEQLAWQSNEACNEPVGSITQVRSNKYADSVKTSLRAEADKRVLYYQPKIGGMHKISLLTEWLAVELASWERSFSTFSTTIPKKMLPSLTVSSSLETSQLNLDYMDIVQLDTASSTPLDSNMAVIRFSKPFYNEDRNRAIVYFESTCGSKRGKGELLMIRYKENRWFIEERRKVWAK